VASRKERGGRVCHITWKPERGTQQGGQDGTRQKRFEEAPRERKVSIESSRGGKKRGITPQREVFITTGKGKRLEMVQKGGDRNLIQQGERPR